MTVTQPTFAKLMLVPNVLYRATIRDFMNIPQTNKSLTLENSRADGRRYSSDNTLRFNSQRLPTKYVKVKPPELKKMVLIRKGRNATMALIIRITNLYVNVLYIKSC